MMKMFVTFPLFVLLQFSLGNGKTETIPRVTYLHVTSEIKFRFASTLISSRLANDGELPTKAVYDVIVPTEAFVSNFSVEMKDSVYTARVKERTKQRYTTTQRRGNKDTVTKRPRNTNIFTIEVNMEPRSTAIFHLTYHEVLQRRLGTYKHTIYVIPDQPVPDLRVDVIIQEPRDLTVLRVLPMTKQNWITDVDLSPEGKMETRISRPTGTTAYITYQPSIQSQTRMRELEQTGPMVIEYDVKRDKDAGDVLVLNGYFVHFFAPKIDNAVPKDVLFILDTSSSMAITKMEQLKVAMKSILQDLRIEDHFNILEFNTITTFWQANQMVPATDDNVQSAVSHILSLRTAGATNINNALTNGIDFLNIYANTNRSLLVFLTDGQASTGLTSNPAILSSVRSHNIHEIPIYSLAFGNDADWSFVKRLAIQNNGLGRRIYEESDAADQITGFYKEISTPVLSGLEFQYLNNAANETSITQTSFKNYFNGSEVIVAGQLAEETTEVLSLVVKADNAGSDVDLKLKSSTEELRPADEPTRLREVLPFQDVPETMWAYLTIKDLLRQMYGEMNANEKENLKRQAVELSLKYNFVTPVTSMVVVHYEEDEIEGSLEEDEDQALADVLTIHHGGWNSRGGRDPHFLLKTAWLDDHLCFDVKGQSRDVVQLLRDPKLGLRVNIMLEGRMSKKGSGRTYIVQVAILLSQLVVVANREGITVNNLTYTWNETILHRAHPVFVVSNYRNGMVKVEFSDGFSVAIYKHVPSTAQEGNEFLNVELDREGRLSTNTTGLLGQFLHSKITMKNPHRVGKKTVAQLEMKTRKKLLKGVAELQMRRDPVYGSMSRCWLLQSGKGIFSIPQKHFLRKSITS